MLVVPALELAGTLPLTPGNIGVASAAAAFALKAHGAGADVALSAGIAFGAVETIASIAFGAGSVLYLAGAVAPDAPPSARRWVTAAVSATGCLALGRRVRRDRALPGRLASSRRPSVRRKLGGSSGSSPRSSVSSCS